MSVISWIVLDWQSLPTTFLLWLDWVLVDGPWHHRGFTIVAFQARSSLLSPPSLALIIAEIWWGRCSLHGSGTISLFRVMCRCRLLRSLR